jgi:hypothetical protein
VKPALLSEKKKEYASALDGYVQCLNDIRESEEIPTSVEAVEGSDDISRRTNFIKDFRGEIMLRIAVVRKETGNIDQAMQMCNTIALEPCNDSVRANALCLKVLYVGTAIFSVFTIINCVISGFAS